MINGGYLCQVNQKKQFILPKLSEKLKQARKQKGLTQGQLAQKMFVQVYALPVPDRHMLKALLDAFIKKHQFEALAMK